MSLSHEIRQCEHVRERLEPFVDGELGSAETWEIRAHLDQCPDCAARARLALEIRRELRSLPELDVPAAVVDRILLRTRQARAVRWLFGGPPGRWPRPAWAALAAAALAIVLGLAVWSPRGATPARPAAAVIAQATAEARLALARTARLTRRAGLVVRDRALRDQIAAPTAYGVTHSLHRESVGDSEASTKGVENV